MTGPSRVNGHDARPRPQWGERPRWQRAALRGALNLYAFAWGFTHPWARLDERMDACARLVLWAWRKGWL